MIEVNGTNFRPNMFTMFDECEKSNEPILITTRKEGREDPQRMIVITEAQYIMMIDRINEVK